MMNAQSLYPTLKNAMKANDITDIEFLLYILKKRKVFELPLLLAEIKIFLEEDENLEEEIIDYWNNLEAE